jgi:hypothetical protein
VVVTAIDTLAISKRLQSAGYSQQQAEEQASIWADVIEEKLATKRDLRELEYRLTIRLGSMTVVAIGLIATLVTLLQ